MHCNAVMRPMEKCDSTATATAAATATANPTATATAATTTDTMLAKVRLYIKHIIGRINNCSISLTKFLLKN